MLFHLYQSMTTPDVNGWWQRNTSAQRFCKGLPRRQHDECEHMMKRAFLSGWNRDMMSRMNNYERVKRFKKIYDPWRDVWWSN